MKNRFGLLLGSFALLLLVGAGCSATAPAADNAAPAEGTMNEGEEEMTDGKVWPEEGEPIRLGLIAPLTGDAAVYGEPNKQITEIAIDKINADGGVNGHLLEVIYEDGRCNGKDASAAMQKLINIDQVKFVIGGFCSGESLAAAPLANENEVVMFSGGSSSPDLTEQGGPFFFRNYPSDAVQGTILAEAAVQEGWTNVGILEEQTDYASALSRTFKETVEDAGGTVQVEAFPTGSSDFRTMLTKLKNAEVDAVFFAVQTTNPALLALRQMEEMGWEPALIGNEIIAGSELIQEESGLLEGMILAEYDYDPENEKLQEILAAYKEKHGVDAPYLTLVQTTYDIPFIYAEAFEAVGTDSNAVREWLLQLENWEGAAGFTTIDENGDLVGGHTAKVVKEGEKVLYEAS